MCCLEKHALEKDELSVRIGRWNIPGEPIVILVDFQPFFEKKDDIYTEMWNRYQVDSLHAYGDYDEASMFSYAAGRVVESFYRYNLTETDKVVYQAHEWMTGMGALYVQEAVPEVATILRPMLRLSVVPLPAIISRCMTICLLIMATRWRRN